MNGRSVFWFSVHLILTVGAYFIPFLFEWQIVVITFGAVTLQFAVFGRCLMNDGHDLIEKDDETFYSDLLERLGYAPNRKRLKRFVRGYLYIILSLVAVGWQLGLEYEPLLPIMSLLK